MGAPTDAIRDNVRGELPELAEIKDAALRDKVVEAWALALARDGFSRISEMEGSGAPGYWVLKRGTQLDHIRGVTRLSIRYADELQAMYPELPLDRDAPGRGRADPRCRQAAGVQRREDRRLVRNAACTVIRRPRETQNVALPLAGVKHDDKCALHLDRRHRHEGVDVLG